MISIATGEQWPKSFCQMAELNKEIVRAGYAWWYWEYDPYDTEMQTLQATARDNHVGLWSNSIPTAPWEWRKSVQSGHYV
jgi:endonuclease YncB( thermonuclease family)